MTSPHITLIQEKLTTNPRYIEDMNLSKLSIIQLIIEKGLNVEVFSRIIELNDI